MIYLASPYSHPDPLIEKTRFLIAESFVLHTLRTEGVMIFSPIVYCHKFAVDNALPGDANSWMTFNMDMLRHADCMYRLELKGWEESKGVKIESNICKMLSIPIVRFNSEFENVADEILQ